MLVDCSFPARYVETDAQQVVYYGNYLVWFELGYEALFAALGRPLGVDRPAVLEATCRYRASVHYGESVTVQSQPLQDEDGRLWIGHTIRVGEEVRAEGTTLLAQAGELAHLQPGLFPAPAKPFPRFEGWDTLAPHGRREEFPLTVRYAETDPAGQAHYSRYFAWLEVGRIGFLHRLGIHYAQMEILGSPFVIAQASCRYLSPVCFDDPLRIEVWLCEVRRRSFCVGYRLFHAEGDRLVALGRTIQAFIGPDRRPAAIPDRIRDVLTAALE